MPHAIESSNVVRVQPSVSEQERSSERTEQRAREEASRVRARREQEELRARQSDPANRSGSEIDIYA